MAFGNTKLKVLENLAFWQPAYLPMDYCLFIEAKHSDTFNKNFVRFLILIFCKTKSIWKIWKMADKKEEKNNPNLGCLEEDDEFEEFPVEGM